MDQLTSSPDKILKSELARLYRKRLLLNSLIRNLERYADLDSRLAGSPFHVPTVPMGARGRRNTTPSDASLHFPASTL